MVYSYVEEIAEAWCQNNGYLTHKDFPFRIKRKTSKQFGWSDIDVLAFKRGETLIINCKTWIHANDVKKILNDMLSAKAFIIDKSKEFAISKNIKLKFVIDVWSHGKKFDKEFKANSVERLDVKELIRQLLISLTRDYIRRDHYFGKETNPINRLFISMAYNNLISDELKKEIYKDYIGKLKKEIKKRKMGINEMRRFLDKICVNKYEDAKKYNKTQYWLTKEEKNFIISKVLPANTDR
jgi:hypothetical protein